MSEVSVMVECRSVSFYRVDVAAASMRERRGHMPQVPQGDGRQVGRGEDATEGLRDSYSYEEVGIQVPAGSIRPGETPEAAALREETGLSDFKIVRKLGETEYDISPYRFEIQHRHVFHRELTEPTPERWMSREDHDGEQAPTHFECFWIPLEAAHILQSGQGALLGGLPD